MTRVVVTGGTGFIGRPAVAALLARGFEVHLVGRGDIVPAGTTSHRLDLLADDPAPLLARIGASHLLHLAWNAEPGKFWNAPDNLDWVAASLRLFRGFAAAGGTRATVAGSCTEYDWSQAHFDETSSPTPGRTLYGVAKASLFRLLTAAAPGLGVSLGWGRVFFLHGAHEKPGRLVADVIDAVAAGHRVATSDGLQRRDFLHVDDVAGALVALLASQVEGPVNIASGAAVPVREVITLAAAADLGLIDFGARPRQAGEPDIMTAAVTRLTAEVGFVPRFGLADGIADTVARRLAARG